MNSKNTDVAVREELANTLSHGLGLLFGIVSIPILITTAIKSGNMAAIIGASVYGFSFLMVYAIRPSS